MGSERGEMAQARYEVAFFSARTARTPPTARPKNRRAHEKVLPGPLRRCQGHRRALHGLLAGRNAAGFERPKAKSRIHVCAGRCIQVHARSWNQPRHWGPLTIAPYGPGNPQLRLCGGWFTGVRAPEHHRRQPEATTTCVIFAVFLLKTSDQSKKGMMKESLSRRDGFFTLQFCGTGSGAVRFCCSASVGMGS